MSTGLSYLDILNNSAITINGNRMIASMIYIVSPPLPDEIITDEIGNRSGDG